MSDPMNLMDLATLGRIRGIRALGGVSAAISAILGVVSMLVPDEAAWLLLVASLLTSLIYSHLVNLAHRLETDGMIQLLLVSIDHGMIRDAE